MNLPLSKRHPSVSRVLTRWRSLTGGASRPDAERSTIVACSGGADSTALALALHSARGLAALAHVVHDMRSRDESLADRDAVQSLATALGVRFVEREIAARPEGGNQESVSRRLRYLALIEMSRELGVPLVATGHHADDQLETIIMRVCRGAAARGLSGIRAQRRLAPDVMLIRPGLAITRAGCERICTDAGVAWRTDATNASLAHARSAIRAQVTPALKSIWPGAAMRAEELARAMSRLDQTIGALARALLDRARTSPNTFARATLRAADPVTLNAALRLAASGTAGSDRMSNRETRKIASAIADASGETRRFRLGPVYFHVQPDCVVIIPVNP